jgi:hypothetical protein
MRITAPLMIALLSSVLPWQLHAQGFPRPPTGPPPTAKAAAPADFTGNWVSIVSEDWRWRMVTPLRNDFSNIPINEAGRKIGKAWDPDKDVAAGEQCRAYGAPAIMREPGRLRISWQGENTLKIETDAGQQTRLFHFDSAAAAATSTATPTWQGNSVARWEQPLQGNHPPGFGLGIGQRAGAKARALEVVTTQIRPGYLRKNGAPYSADTKVTEYFDLFKDPDGVDWFVVTTVVADPQFLSAPWVTTSHFKREKDGSRWKPTPCSAT